MNLTIWLYIADIISSFNDILSFIFVFISIVLIIFSIMSLSSINSDDQKKIIKIWSLIYKKIWIIILLVLMVILTPSQKTMYLMLGSSYLSNTNLPNKVQEALELKLDDVIKDLKDKNDKK